MWSERGCGKLVGVGEPIIQQEAYLWKCNTVQLTKNQNALSSKSRNHRQYPFQYPCYLPRVLYVLRPSEMHIDSDISRSTSTEINAEVSTKCAESAYLVLTSAFIISVSAADRNREGQNRNNCEKRSLICV